MKGIYFAFVLLISQAIAESGIVFKSLDDGHFCEFSPLIDIVHYYCGYYGGFDAQYLQNGTIFSSEFELESSDKTYFVDVSIQLKNSFQKVMLSPQITNITSQ